jgi:serine protease AprX
VVSGLVADLLQAQPQLNPDQVKARLMKTAYKTFPASSSVYDPASGITYTDQYDVFTVGAGYVDIAAALANTDVAIGTAMSPTAVYNSQTGEVYLSSDPSSVWGTSYTWSGPAVWGSNQFVGGSSTLVSAPGSGNTAVMWGTTGVAGSSFMWGASNSSGFSTIWSNSFMWGASGDWGSSFMWGANVDLGE